MGVKDVEGKDGKEWRRCDAERADRGPIRAGIIAAAEAAGMTPRQQIRPEPGHGETLVNIISGPYDSPGCVWVRTFADDTLSRLELADHGRHFHPLAGDRRPTDGVPSVDQKEGGCGGYPVRKNFSLVGCAYEELSGKMANHLTMKLLLS